MFQSDVVSGSGRERVDPAVAKPHRVAPRPVAMRRPDLEPTVVFPRMPRRSLPIALLVLAACGSGTEPTPTSAVLPILAVRGMVLRPGEESPVMIRIANGDLVRSSALTADDSVSMELSDLRVGGVTQD